jgi:hypothetical protein
MSGRPWGTSYSPFVRQEYQANFRFDSNLGLWISTRAGMRQATESEGDLRSSCLFHDTGRVDAVRAGCESDGRGEDEHPANPRPGPESVP